MQFVTWCYSFTLQFRVMLILCNDKDSDCLIFYLYLRCLLPLYTHLSIQHSFLLSFTAKTVQSTKLENEPLIHPQQVTRLSTLMQSQPSTPSLFSMPGTPPPNSIIPLTPGGLYSPSTPVYYSPAECSDSSFYPPVGYVDCACLPPDTPSGIYQSVYPPQFTFPEPVVYQQMVPQSPTVSNSFST